MRPLDPDIEMVLRVLNDPERDALQRLIDLAVKEGAARVNPEIIKIELAPGAGATRMERRIEALFTTPKRERKPRSRPPDGLHSRSEAAAKIGCSPRTLDGHVASGALRYVNVGRGSKRQRKMFTDPDLNAFIEAQSRKDVPCPSTRIPARRTGSSISGAEVIAFSAAPRPRPGAKPKR